MQGARSGPALAQKFLKPDHLTFHQVAVGDHRADRRSEHGVEALRQY